jgi:septal ring factor EnvC (AmiA/AmiB activator)
MLSVFLLIPFLVSAKGYQSQLQKVKKEIDIKKKEMGTLNQKEKSILNELEQINRKVAKSQKKINELKIRELGFTETIEGLKLEEQKTETNISLQKRLIEERIKLFYQYSVSNPTNLLVSNYPIIVSYAKQVLKTDINQYSTLKEMKITFSSQTEQEKNELNKLLEIKNQQEAEQGKIFAQSQKKKQVLNNIKEEKSKKAQLIKELEASRAGLEKLIAKVPKHTVQEYTTEEFSPIIWPIRGKIINYFGMTIDQRLGTKLINKGIDISAPYGTNVVVISNGTVIHEGDFLGYGKIVLIDHLNGFCSLYGYLSETLVSKGDKITQGEVIGRVGTTGLSSESVLHFELRKNGEAVDPLKWLR